MNPKLFKRIINEMDRSHKALIESMENNAKKGLWDWAIPTDNPSLESFAYAHGMTKEVAKHYRDIIKLKKEQYEKYKIYEV